LSAASVKGVPGCVPTPATSRYRLLVRRNATCHIKMPQRSRSPDVSHHSHHMCPANRTICLVVDDPSSALITNTHVTARRQDMRGVAVQADHTFPVRRLSPARVDGRHHRLSGDLHQLPWLSREPRGQDSPRVKLRARDVATNTPRHLLCMRGRRCRASSYDRLRSGKHSRS